MFSSFAQPSLTTSDIKQWAAGACASFLDGGTAPTDSLVKIARERSLTPHQVEVLAGEINQTIHKAKYASAEDKYNAAGFPLADARAAVAQLQTLAPQEKIAFEMPEPVVNQNFDYFEAFGVKPEEMDKTASVRADMRASGQKLASLTRMQRDSAFMSKEAAANAELTFVKTARQMVLEGLDQKDRLKKLGMAIHAASCTSHFDIARKPLAKLATAFAIEGYLTRAQAEKVASYLLEKTADQTAPEELISEFLHAKVVNGQHPLIISLKTYADACERAEEESRRENICDDKTKIFEQRIRAL